MANLKDKIGKNLQKQKEIEGDSPALGLLFRVLDIVKTSNDWQALTKVKHHRYGTLSYECYHFYYPSDLLMSLQDLFEVDQIVIETPAGKMHLEYVDE